MGEKKYLNQYCRRKLLFYCRDESKARFISVQCGFPSCESNCQCLFTRLGLMNLVCAQHAALLEKKSDEEVLTHKEEVKGHEPELEVPGADVKDIEARLKSVEEKRETPEDEERNQESWDLNDEKEKRIWKPTHRYHHKEVSEEKREEPDEERSQESWSLGDEKEKRYRPTYRYTPKTHHKRDEDVKSAVRNPGI
ncbi:unnamed protein product [Oncorhynchus mykiss]|uniref:Uncharacterized protein n=1 Tax=Oncorhynchus mykiss TaxID=8022 RepID=A0A060XNY5_ONCMY|nr:unnamed protein product [Oncorhynchus mykiss]